MVNYLYYIFKPLTIQNTIICMTVLTKIDTVMTINYKMTVTWGGRCDAPPQFGTNISE